MYFEVIYKYFFWPFLLNYQRQKNYTVPFLILLSFNAFFCICKYLSLLHLKLKVIMIWVSVPNAVFFLLSL